MTEYSNLSDAAPRDSTGRVIVKAGARKKMFAKKYNASGREIADSDEDDDVDLELSNLRDDLYSTYPNHGPNHGPNRLVRSRSMVNTLRAQSANSRNMSSRSNPSSRTSTPRTSQPSPLLTTLSRSQTLPTATYKTLARGPLRPQHTLPQKPPSFPSSYYSIESDSDSESPKHLPPPTPIARPVHNWKTLLLTTGANHSSQLGHKEDAPYTTTLTIVPLPPTMGHICFLTTSATATYILTNTSDLYSFGAGALGHATAPHPYQKTPIPQKLNVGHPISQVAAGLNHAALITQTGKLFTWGLGGDGRLGHGDTTPRVTPCQVKGIGGDGGAVRIVACGERHTMCLVESGGDQFVEMSSWENDTNDYDNAGTGGVRSLYAFGSNKGGQLGTGDFVTAHSPRLVTCSAWRRACTCKSKASISKLRARRASEASVSH